MLRFLDEQLGRILLGVAVICAGAAVCLSPARKFPEVPPERGKRPVQVKLDKSKLTANNREVFFVTEYAPPWRLDKEPESFTARPKVKDYVPVDLALPPAGVMRPPQVLPEPGPALEGTHNLPRYGDEFPPIGAADAPPGGAPVAAPGVAKPPGVPTAPVLDPTKPPPKPGPPGPAEPKTPGKPPTTPGTPPARDVRAPPKDSAPREDRHHGRAQERNF